jgi:hypothetical protein
LPWDAGHDAGHDVGAAVDTDERAFLDAMGLWELKNHPVQLATLWGATRPAMGCDRALLDLSPYEHARILVPRADRPAWDADLLARSWSEQPWARQHHVAFVPIDAGLLQQDSFRHAVDAEFAASLDDDQACDKFADLLREAVDRSLGGDALLLGPWLGVQSDVAGRLAQRLGMPVGETLTLMGGAAGARFEMAAEKLLADIRVDRLCECVVELRASEVGWEARCRHADDLLRSKAVVVACGSFVGGGVVLTSAEEAQMCEVPPRPTSPFSLSFRSPLCLAVDGQVNHFVASLQGLNLERLAWPHAPQQRWVLDRVNVFHDGVQALDAEGSPIRGVFVGGEVAYDHAHAMLSSVATGLQAGASAAAFAS